MLGWGGAARSGAEVGGGWGARVDGREQLREGWMWGRGPAKERGGQGGFFVLSGLMFGAPRLLLLLLPCILLFIFHEQQQ